MTKFRRGHIVLFVLCWITVSWGAWSSKALAQSGGNTPEEERFSETDPVRPVFPNVPEPVPEPRWKNSGTDKPPSLQRRKPRVRLNLDSKLNFLLGDARLWGEMERNYYMLQISGLGFDLHVRNTKTQNHIGFRFETFRLDMEYWGELFNDVDSYRLFTGEFGKVALELGKRGFFLRSGWTFFRIISFGLPERVLNRSVVKQLPFERQRNLYLEGSPQFMLPDLAVGWGNQKLRFEAWVNLLSWDFQSYAVGGRFIFSIPELTLTLESKFQREAMAMEWSQGSEENLDLPNSFWVREFWESSLVLSFDIAVAFRKKHRHITGPVQLVFGIRYRHMFENYLHDTTGTLFQEERNGNFAVFGGVRISFGTNKLNLRSNR